MDNATAVAIKFAFTALLSAFILPAVALVAYGQAVLLAAIVTAVSYPVGDLSVLPRYGNAATVVVDFLIALLLFRYAPIAMSGTAVGWGGALTAAGGIALAEIVFHTYLERTFLKRS